jgi:hypothetical protein
MPSTVYLILSEVEGRTEQMQRRSMETGFPESL